MHPHQYFSTAPRAEQAQAAGLDPVEVFRERAEARALLWAANEFDLHEAVDVLQADAERSGLVDLIGQDSVEAIIATAFAAVRAPRPHLPCDEDEPTVDCGVARSTIDALEYLIRENDGARLRAFIAKHGARERAAITDYLRNREGRSCRSRKSK